jgi:hypothetical protein
VKSVPSAARTSERSTAAARRQQSRPAPSNHATMSRSSHCQSRRATTARGRGNEGAVVVAIFIAPTMVVILWIAAREALRAWWGKKP